MIRPAIALGFSLLLPACNQAEKAPVTAETITTDKKPGLMLIDGRLVLPAVTGNPGAVYFKLANAGETDTAIVAVDVTGATRAEMHETTDTAMKPLKSVPLTSINTVIFEPGGKHVMVFGLDPAVKPGDAQEMTITFADGDKLSTPLKVEKAGAMVDHGDMH